LIIGKTINLRYVEVEDAQFIVDMRNDERIKISLSSTSSDVDVQIKWIEDYKRRENDGKEHYFIIESKSAEAYGTIRVYNINENACEMGSWMLKEKLHYRIALESNLLCYKYVFENLKVQNVYLEVVNDNVKVIKYHKWVGCRFDKKDESFHYFSINPEIFHQISQKFPKYLPAN